MKSAIDYNQITSARFRVKFNLLFPNKTRQRLVGAIMVAWLLGGLLLVIKLDESVGFGLLIALPVMAFSWSFFPKLADRVFWCPFWAVIAQDGVAWQKATPEQLARYEFADIKSYRFIPNKGSILLRLRLNSGASVELVCRYNDEFAAFQTTFDQAARAYAQAHHSAELVEESNAFELFFTRRSSTYVLVSILAIDVLLIIWGNSAGTTGVQYAPVVLSFPYFLVWVAYAGKRT